jgi:hypothetical protein
MVKRGNRVPLPVPTPAPNRRGVGLAIAALVLVVILLGWGVLALAGELSRVGGTVVRTELGR